MIVVALAVGVALVWVLLVLLFAPGLDYHVRRPLSPDSEEFLRLLQVACQAARHEGNRVEIFTNGREFYPAMLEAIRGARRSINAECYIFWPGRVARDFLDALTERARAGVAVNLVLDALGSSALLGRWVHPLKAAGGRVYAYQGLTWHSIARLNNRTHRELLVVDGRTAFLGGAGIADWWREPDRRGRPPWRDTMARLEGPVVAAIQGVFAENWVECCGEILTGEEYFPPLERAGETTALVVKSSPSDRATVSRVVFQLLVEGARRRLLLTTPYFLPDRSLRRALIAAAARGVDIEIILPGPSTDQRLVRLASRRLYGSLLRAGIRIFEYQPTMMHAKVAVVDDLWAVLGTTNIDNRSFEHNDEVNVALRDPVVAARLVEDFRRDRAACREITFEAWRARRWGERVVAPFAALLERQQ
jgi:cardiolipin synthase